MSAWDELPLFSTMPRRVAKVDGWAHEHCIVARTVGGDDILVRSEWVNRRRWSEVAIVRPVTDVTPAGGGTVTPPK